MDFNVIWEKIPSWVIMLAQVFLALLTMSGGSKVIKTNVGKFFTKSAKDFTTGAFSKTLANDTAKALLKNTIKLDIKTVTEQRIDDVANKFMAQIDNHFEKTLGKFTNKFDTLQISVYGLIDLLVRGKEMTEMAKQELLKTLSDIRGDLVDTTPPIEIKLDDIEGVVEPIVKVMSSKNDTSGISLE